MKKTFIEMKLFQVKPDRLEQFEEKIEEMSANQLKCEGCLSLKYFKRFYTIDGIELGEPPRELTKIVKCVKYYSYWEFDTKENYGRAIKLFFENYNKDLILIWDILFKRFANTDLLWLTFRNYC